MSPTLRAILTLGIPQLIDAIERLRDKRQRRKIEQLEKELAELRELIKYREFVLKQNEQRRLNSPQR